MNTIIQFLVAVFAWPVAVIWRHPSYMLPLFLILVLVLFAILVAKRFEKTSEFARISKRVLLICGGGFFGIWFPAAAVLSIVWVGGH